jgi:hypothetical protein
MGNKIGRKIKIEYNNAKGPMKVAVELINGS